MGFEIQTISDGVAPGDVATFTFQNPVQAWALGFGAFDLLYEGTDGHHVQTLALGLDGEQTMVEVATDSTTVSALVRAELSDASGNTISPSSKVYPCCVAMTGSDDGGTTLGTYQAVNSGEAETIQLPASSGFNFASSFLDGFNLSYGNGVDHQVLSASVGCNLPYAESQGYLKGTATMGNGTDFATTARITPSAFATLDDDTVVAVQRVKAQTDPVSGPTGPVSVTFDGMPTIGQAIVLVDAWQVTFSEQHDVYRIGAGALTGDVTFAEPQVSGNTVTLPHLRAFVRNWSGDHQDDSKSWAGALVVAVA